MKFDSGVTVIQASDELVDDLMGLGAMAEKPEGSETEKVIITPVRRKFCIWFRRRPFALGFIVSKYNLKLYLTFWFLAIGWMITEVEWKRG